MVSRLLLLASLALVAATGSGILDLTTASVYPSGSGRIATYADLLVQEVRRRAPTAAWRIGEARCEHPRAMHLIVLQLGLRVLAGKFGGARAFGGFFDHV
jgi:hypothetical protein